MDIIYVRGWTEDIFSKRNNHRCSWSSLRLSVSTDATTTSSREEGEGEKKEVGFVYYARRWFETGSFLLRWTEAARIEGGRRERGRERWWRRYAAEGGS